MNWPEVFGNTNPIHVEIGIGNGEYLVRQAKNFPDVNFVGIEQMWDRAQKALKLFERERVSNVRVFMADARIIFERFFLPQTIAEIYSLFPCPWPKKKHTKHRLFSHDFLKLVNSRLKTDGVFRVVTDDAKYRDWILEQIPSTGFVSNSEIISAIHNTKYERKWSAQGQKEFCALALQKKQPADAAFKEDVDLEVRFVKNFAPEKFVMKEQKNDPLGISIVFKDFFYDADKKRAMVHLIVTEPNLAQHFWAHIAFSPKYKNWSINTLDGYTFIPSAGIARALELIYESISA